MNNWWSAMTSFEHIYWVIAIAASVFLAIQLILVSISGMDFHVGSDLGAHGGVDTHHGGDFGVTHFQLLTLRNLVAFFALFGWSGLAFYHKHIPVFWTIFLSYVCGLVMMFMTAGLFFILSKLQSSGNVDISVIEKKKKLELLGKNDKII